MATRPLPDLEYVPYTDDDDDEAIVPQPQVLRPTLVARPKPPSNPAPAPAVSRSLPEPSTEVSPSTRMLLTMAIVVVLLGSFLAMVVHTHVPQAARVRHPAVFDPSARHPAKPSAYGEAFTLTAPARKPRTRIALPPTPPPDDSSTPRPDDSITPPQADSSETASQ